MRTLLLALLVACSSKTKPVVDAKPEPKVSDTKPVEPAKPQPSDAPIAATKPVIDVPSPWKRVDDGGYDLLKYELTSEKGAFLSIQIREVENKAIVVGGAAPPMEPDKYGEWLAGEYKRKITKKEKLGDAVAYDYSASEAGGKSRYEFDVYVKAGGKLWSCGGGDDVSSDTKEIKMTKAISDEIKTAIAAGKKICATLH